MNIKQLRSFISFRGYYRRFIKGFGRICIPLHDLLKTEGFLWTDNTTKEFEKLKDALISTLVLTPNYALTFLVEINASGKGIGDVLMQEGHPLSYISRSLTP